MLLILAVENAKKRMYERVMLVLQDNVKTVINKYKRKMTDLSEVLTQALILSLNLSILAKMKASVIAKLIF